jgi:zinc transport system substrate-binding protein
MMSWVVNMMMAAMALLHVCVADAGAGIKVVVTVAPLKGIVEPLLPAGSELAVLMQPGRSEHGYEFSPKELSQLAGADVVVYVGLNLEPRVAEVLNATPDPKRRVVCFGEVVGLQQAGEAAANPEHSHDHEHGEACDHGPVDQHLWLDPVLVKQLVPAVAAAVRSKMTEAGVEESGLAAIRDAELRHVHAIDVVDQEWRDGISKLGEVSIVTHHNAFSRPAERYGFKVAAVIRTMEGREPTPADIASVVSEIRAQKVRAIFVEPQFNAKTAERIAKSAKVKLGKLDPLGDGDWFALMRSNLASIRESLGETERK